MKDKDIRNEEFWKSNQFPRIAKEFIEKHDIHRFRLCARGEPISEVQDLVRLRKLALLNQHTLFKIPTRSWRDPVMRSNYGIIDRLPNIRLIASIDPSNTLKELEIASSYKTLFFGNDEHHPFEAFDIPVIKCKSKWEHIKGMCNTCRNGCFDKEVTHVWLKEH
jgi:hypothetical protein